jgi:hypothetical protein
MIKEILEHSQIDPEVMQARGVALDVLAAYLECVDPESKEILFKMFMDEVRLTIDLMITSDASRAVRRLHEVQKPEVSRN